MVRAAGCSPACVGTFDEIAETLNAHTTSSTDQIAVALP
jgi:hypothetical protein